MAHKKSICLQELGHHLQWVDTSSGGEFCCLWAGACLLPLIINSADDYCCPLLSSHLWLTLMENRNPPRPLAKCIDIHLEFSDVSIMVTCHELSHDVLWMIKPSCMGLSMQGTKQVRGNNYCFLFIGEASFSVALHLLPQPLFLGSFLRMKHLIPEIKTTLS